MKRGLIGVRISFEDKKIYENKFNNTEEMDKALKIVKKKLM